MKLRKGDTGASTLTTIVFGLILAAVVYYGFNVLPFFYDYFEIQSQFDQIVRIASAETDQEIRKRLMYHIKHLGLPVEPEELKIERDGERIRISLPYEDVFFITYKGRDYIIQTFKFHAYAEGWTDEKRSQYGH